MLAREFGFPSALAIAVAGALMGGLASVSSAAPATNFYVGLRYAVEGAAESCWDEAQFRRQVAASVGYDPFRSDAAVSVQVHVGASGGLVDGRVEWRSAEGADLGERRFRAKDGDCRKLLTEISFAVGLQIELLRPKSSTGASAPAASASGVSGTTALPSAAPPGAKRAPPAAPPSRTTTSEPSELTPGPSDAPANASAWRFHAGVGPSLAFGSAPAVTGHGRLFAGAEQRQLSFELGLEGTLPVTEREADGSGFRQYILGGSVTACRQFGIAAGCLIGKAGQLRIAGFGVDEPRAPAAFVAQAGVRVGARLNLSDTWFVSPHADALGLLTPRSVTLNQAAVWHLPTLSALVGIDAGGRFR